MVSFVVGETVWKVKHSSVRIENPLLALYSCTEYFSLAWAFRTAWGGRLSKWSNISKWKPRICFRQCIGILTISLLLGLLRQSGIRPSWQTWFSVLCWTSSFYGNRGMPRDGSERGSWQVDQAMWILYDIDVEQVSWTSLKLSSAKRVEKEVHHLSAYLLPCFCAAV